MAATIIREESFDPADYRGELDAAPENGDVGTRLWFENQHIRVWEVRLMPGERGPFHAHTRRYFWTVVDGGIGHSPDEPMIHDFENAGDTPIRFTTVELLD